MNAYIGPETIWAQYNEIAQANKEKRKSIGRWSEKEPVELIYEPWEDEELYDEDGRPIPTDAGWMHRNLYSAYWVRDLFDADFRTVTTLLCSHEDNGMTMINDNIYYRERFIVNSLEILSVLAKTSIVNALRPLPQSVIGQASPVYTSKDLMRILGIKEATLKKYRDNGLLGYTQKGDKIWYQQKDLDNFLNHSELRREQF